MSPWTTGLPVTGRRSPDPHWISNPGNESLRFYPEALGLSR